MNWWLYYSTVPYMFRRIIKQPSGCYIQNIHMTVLQKIFVLFENTGTEISEHKIGFQKNCPQSIFTIIIPIKLNL